jgi:hypothetical protein
MISPASGEITAEVQHFDAHRAHLLDDVEVVDLARLDGFEHRLSDGALVKPLLSLLREAFAVSLAVVEDCDGLLAPALGEKIACDPALEVVPANYAEYVGEALLGELRIGSSARSRADLAASM